MKTHVFYNFVKDNYKILESELDADEALKKVRGKKNKTFCHIAIIDGEYEIAIKEEMVATDNNIVQTIGSCFIGAFVDCFESDLSMFLMESTQCTTEEENKTYELTKLVKTNIQHDAAHARLLELISKNASVGLVYSELHKYLLSDTNNDV